MTMLSEVLFDTLWRAHLGLSLGLAAVLLLRRPWRRFAGAQAAYALWLLPLWLAAAALLPRASLPGWVLPPVLVTGPRTAALADMPAVWALSMTGLWAAGVLAVAAAYVALHWRYRRRLQHTTGGHLLAPVGDSPGLLGLWHARLVLPADFRQRFDRSERRWILAHESAHARRLDNPARMLAAALAALAWFNPLAWWALGALRHDQELACDATVMQRYPGSWRRYGLAMLKLDGALRVPPTASAWQSHHPLKERIMLLKKTAPRADARRATRLALAVSALLGFGAVQALNAGSPDAASASKPASQRMKATEACPQMVKPELPQLPDTIKGDYRLDVKFRIGRNGHPDAVQVQGQGDPLLVDAVQKAVQSYGCKTALAGTEVEQQFAFKID
ncbi:M56 family metallopeptidase [Roseateles sp. NT4]|uniref:M56 family metallopeptidase n=1 Tax=Roseateles sp. NT4 TaxID=3453715 RepID=UPI003EEF0563